MHRHMLLLFGIVAGSLVGAEVPREASGLEAPLQRKGLTWLVVVGTVVFYVQRWLRQRLAVGVFTRPTGTTAKIHTEAVRVLTCVEADHQSPPQTEKVTLSTSSSWLACCCSCRAGEAEDEVPLYDLGLQCQTEFGRTVPEVDEVAVELCEELRSRLADLFGRPGCPPTAPQADVALTVRRYGGERSCFSRFLRARRCDVKLAELMLREAVDFRRQHDLNSIIEDTMESWRSERSCWPATMPFFTHDGSLVVYFKIAHFLTVFRMGYTEERCRMIYFNMMERSVRLQHEGRQRRRQGPDDELPPVYEVYDFSGAGFAHLSCVLGLRTFSSVLGLGQKLYPENLRKAILINVPRVSQPIWNNVIAPVLDVRTQGKIRVTAGDGRELLSEVMGATRKDVNTMLRSIGVYSESRKFIRPGGRDIITCEDLMDKLDISLGANAGHESSAPLLRSSLQRC